MAVYLEEASNGILPELSFLGHGKVKRISRTYMLTITSDGGDLERFDTIAQRYPGGRADLIRDVLLEYLRPEIGLNGSQVSHEAINLQAEELGL